VKLWLMSDEDKDSAYVLWQSKYVYIITFHS